MLLRNRPRPLSASAVSLLIALWAQAKEPSEATPAEPEPRHRLPERLDPAKIPLNESGDFVQLAQASQILVRDVRKFEGSGQDASSKTELQLRRLRLILDGSFIGGKLKSALQVNAVPGALELIDIWVSYEIDQDLSLRIGQYKIPYTRYRTQSFSTLSLVDWSPVTRTFGSERQVGVQTRHEASSTLPLDYALGIFTGQNARSSHGVGVADAYAEPPESPSDLTASDRNMKLHPEFVGRVSKSFGPINTKVNSAWGDGESVRQHVALSTAYDLAPVHLGELSLRMAAEWLFKLEHFYLNVLGHSGWTEVHQTTSFAAVGALGELGYRFDRHWEVATRYSHVRRSDAAVADALAHAGEQSVAAPEEASRDRDAGRIDAVEELAVAVNSYVIGRNLKAQLEGAWLAEHAATGTRDSWSTRLQMQFAF